MATDPWPNLFIVGAAKAGTTSLHHYLDRHPDVYMTPFKEPHFFSQIEPDPKLAAFFPRVTEPRAYLALFEKGSAAHMRGESSTSYLSSPEVPAEIKAVSPEAKILIMLRDPIRRAYSNYWNDVREGFEHRTFEQAVTDEVRAPGGRWGATSLYVDCGYYAERVSRYLDAFGDNVLVLFFEEFIADPYRAVERTFRFLRVPPIPPSAIGFESHNAFALPRNAMTGRILGSATARSLTRRLVPRSVRARGRGLLVAPAQRPEMEPVVRSRLHDLYRDDVQALSTLLDRPMPWPAFDPTAT